MSIATALDALRRLRLLLAEEVERARDERRLLRGLDGTALLERASGRARFNAQLAEAELAVAEGLRALAARAGLTELSLEALRRPPPARTWPTPTPPATRGSGPTSRRSSPPSG